MEINKNNWITNLFTEELIKLSKKNKKVILLDSDLKEMYQSAFVVQKKALQQLNWKANSNIKQAMIDIKAAII
jgi:transketolase C-terminal domain/subunit